MKNNKLIIKELEKERDELIIKLASLKSFSRKYINKEFENIEFNLDYAMSMASQERSMAAYIDDLNSRIALLAMEKEF